MVQEVQRYTMVRRAKVRERYIMVIAAHMPITAPLERKKAYIIYRNAHVVTQ